MSAELIAPSPPAAVAFTISTGGHSGEPAPTFAVHGHVQVGVDEHGYLELRGHAELHGEPLEVGLLIPPSELDELRDQIDAAVKEIRR